MSASLTTDCCIVGGGPAGLLLGVLLARRGRDVTVLDRRPALSAGLPPVAPYLHPPTLAVLDDADLLTALRPTAQPVYGATEYGTAGVLSKWRYADVDGCRYPYALSVRLDHLADALVQAAAGLPRLSLLTGSTVARLSARADGGYDLYATVGGAERHVEAAVIVASDGKFSRLRSMAGIEAEVFTFDRPVFQLVLERPDDWPEELVIHRRPPRYLLTLPIAGGKLAALWIAEPDEHARIQAAGLPALKEAMLAVEPALAGPLQGATDWQHVDDLVHHVVQPERWVSGNLVLHGDAAHAMHFHGGQGLNFALQDATPLAAAIDETLRAGRLGPLRAYEAYRRPFVERFQNAQKRMPELTSRAADIDDRPFWSEWLVRIMTVGQEPVRGPSASDVGR